MAQFTEGDRVKIDIPDVDDPDHNRYHGEHGTVVAIIEDNAGRNTGDSRDSVIYRVESDDQGTVDLRWRDLRPVPE